jgi:hypothetical protein
VDVPGVPQQVLDLPGFARGDGGVESGPAGRVGEQVTLAAQRVDVLSDLHVAILPG